MNWSRRLRDLALTDADIIDQSWTIEGRNGGNPTDLVKTHEARVGAVHRIWLTSAVAQSAYDVISTIELPSPGGGAPTLKPTATFTVSLLPQKKRGMGTGTPRAASFYVSC